MITLKTLPQATAQQVFDQVAKHLLTQNEKSRDTAGCKYRGPEGLTCAAGCLISDEEYDAYRMEGKRWAYVAKMNAVGQSHSGIISDLQWVHDHNPTIQWRNELRCLAGRYGLEYKEAEYVK